MIARAVARYIRISPRKVRLVAKVIKGKSIDEALAILSNLNKRACEFIEEVLRSAINNAKNKTDIKEDELYISRLIVNGGPMLKRYRAGSMGRAMRITHRTSHITVELDVRSKRPKSISTIEETKPKKGLLKTIKERGR